MCIKCGGVGHAHNLPHPDAIRSAAGAVTRKRGEAMDKDVIPYLKLMVERNASDLVFSVGTVPHMKLEGVTWPLKAPVLEPGDVKELAYGIMTRKQIAAFEATFEMNLALSVNDIGRFRVN